MSHISASAIRATRFFSRVASQAPPPLAFAFDIDGVLLRGKQVIPAAHRALDILNGDNPWRKPIPFILMTNGGGTKESLRVEYLSKVLQTKIDESQFIQSHTVLRDIAQRSTADRERHILAVGGLGTSVRDVAESYGFQNAHIPLDILRWNPEIWPLHEMSEFERSATRATDFSKAPISSIYIFHDPRNWGLDIQIITDVLLGAYLPPHLKPQWGQVELAFCNPDLLWRAGFEEPRYGQGAFRESLLAVLKARTGAEYPYTQFGKPHKVTYDYGKKLLRSRVEEMGYVADQSWEPEIFMVGDNPESDIAGANAASWSSFLVRTGVFQNGEQTGADSGNDSGYESDDSTSHPSVPTKKNTVRPTHEPTEIVDDVAKAVERGVEMAWRRTQQ